MKIKRGVILPIMLFCFLLTGCGGIKDETRQEILRCLVKEDYIAREDSLECTGRAMGTGPLPVVMYYDYMYCDGNGELYNVRIYPSHSQEQEKYGIEIFYDIETEESVVESGGREYMYTVMSDYTDMQELRVERRNWFIFKWYVVA